MFYKIILIIICAILGMSLIYERDMLLTIRENKILYAKVDSLGFEIDSFKKVLGEYGRVAEGNLVAAKQTWDAIQFAMKDKKVRSKVRKALHE